MPKVLVRKKRLKKHDYYVKAVNISELESLCHFDFDGSFENGYDWITATDIKKNICSPGQVSEYNDAKVRLGEISLQKEIDCTNNFRYAVHEQDLKLKCSYLLKHRVEETPTRWKADFLAQSATFEALRTIENVSQKTSDDLKKEVKILISSKTNIIGHAGLVVAQNSETSQIWRNIRTLLTNYPIKRIRICEISGEKVVNSTTKLPFMLATFNPRCLADLVLSDNFEGLEHHLSRKENFENEPQEHVLQNMPRPKITNSMQGQIMCALPCVITRHKPFKYFKLLWENVEKYEGDYLLYLLLISVEHNRQDIATEMLQKLGHLEKSHHNLLREEISEGIHHSITRSGSLQMIEFCKDKGLSYDEFVNMPNKSTGQTVLHLAVLNKSVEFVNYLLHNQVGFECLNHKDKQGNSALYYAAMLDVPVLIEILLSKGANHGIIANTLKTPWMVAIEYEGKNSLRLFEEKIDVSGPVEELPAVVYHKGETTMLHLASALNNTKCMRYLIRTGCEPNIKASGDDITEPLFTALQHKRSQAIELLCETGKCGLHDLNILREANLHTALSVYAPLMKKWGDLIPLIDAGANLNMIHPITKMLPLTEYIAQVPWLYWLIYHGANPNLRDDHGKSLVYTKVEYICTFHSHKFSESIVRSFHQLLNTININIYENDQHPANVKLGPLALALQSQQIRLAELLFVCGFRMKGYEEHVLCMDNYTTTYTWQDSWPSGWCGSEISDLEAFLDIIKHHISKPRSLKETCRLVILSMLDCHCMRIDVYRLGLPQMLVEYLQWESFIDSQMETLSSLMKLKRNERQIQSRYPQTGFSSYAGGISSVGKIY